MLNNYLKNIFKQTIIQNAIIRRAKFSTSSTTGASAAATGEGHQQNLKPVAATELSKELVELPKFTSTESEQILSLINNNTTEQLLCYDISKARATKLHSWKTRNGPLSSIDDILYVEGFGLKVATKFCRSLLEPASKSTADTKQTKAARVAPFVIPSLDEEQRLSIKSCVAVRIGVSSVTWSRLTLPDDELNPLLLTHWHHHELTDKKLHLNDLVQRCLYTVYQIPEADCYLFENPQMAQISNNPGSVDQQNISIQKSQVTAILSYALAARNSNEGGNQLADEQLSSTSPGKAKPTKCTVFYLRRFLTARLFNHLVGTERVSSENTVIKLMRTHYNLVTGGENFNNDDYLVNEEKMLTEEKEKDNTNVKRPSFRENIDFPMELRKIFSNAERYQREFLGQSLLLNLAFVRLVLLQDAASIAAVTNRSGKINTENIET